MARRPRLLFAGAPQHIIQRGNNRQATFFAEEDYRSYLDWLLEAVKKYDCRIYAYVLMTNHIHVLLEEWETPLGKVLYTWKRLTATRANALLGLSGRFWQPEYWDRYMRDKEHFNKARRYIESNPVKAGLRSGAADWPWSSANPKWSWNLEEGQSRYMGGHLAISNWTKFVERVRGAGGAGAQAPMQA